MSYINPNPLGIFTRKYPESTKIHQFCHTQNAGVLNPSESASVYWTYPESAKIHH